MSQRIRAVFQNGVLRPLQPLDLQENAEVRLTVEDATASQEIEVEDYEDPLADIRIETGIPDLAEHFDDYRFGRRQP